MILSHNNRNITIDMGASKNLLFSNSQNQLAEFAKALGHPARIAILQELVQRECVCGDLVSSLPLSQSTISQHLKALKAANIIEGEIEGTRVCYRINQDYWKKAATLLSTFLKQPISCC